MGVRVLYDEQEGMAAIYDSVSGLPVRTPVFGPGPEAKEEAEDFVAWLDAGAGSENGLALDVRGVPARGLERLRDRWQQTKETGA